MERADIRTQWEAAAPGWSRWEATVATWMEPATEAMLAMAGVDVGARVLDLASGAGSQTLRAARKVGPQGHVVASDIAETMLHYVRDSARAAGLANVTTLAAAAEHLDVAADSFDAVICRLGLMLFAEPARALAVVQRAMRPGGKIAAVVFTTPAANPFMAQPMRILLRHADKAPPAPGRPGIFSLGAPGVLEHLLLDSGFAAVEQRTMTLPLRMPSAAQGGSSPDARELRNPDGIRGPCRGLGDRGPQARLMGDGPLSILIRPESTTDHDAIRSLTARAFAGLSFSDGSEPRVIDKLREAEALAVSLVAVVCDRVVGHIAFSRVGPPALQGWFALGPVSVEPSLQRRGVGKQLVEAGLRDLRAQRAKGCVLLGDHRYYRRFGFVVAPTLAPPGYPAEHFQVLSFGASPPNARVVFHDAFSAAP